MIKIPSSFLSSHNLCLGFDELPASDICMTLPITVWILLFKFHIFDELEFIMIWAFKMNSHVATLSPRLRWKQQNLSYVHVFHFFPEYRPAFILFIYLYMCVYVHTYIYIIYLFILLIFIYIICIISIHIIYLYMCMYLHTYIHTFIYIGVCMYIHTYINTYLSNTYKMYWTGKNNKID